MEQGPTEKTIIEQSIRSRTPLPKAIANAPQLELGLEIFYLAFMDLTTCRYVQDGPIPWSCVRDYCEELELLGDQRDDMYTLIRDMDAAYLDYRSGKLRKEMAQRAEAAKQSSSKGRR